MQDLGRPNWRSSGVPAGGAADINSHRLANLLVANDETAATLEWAGGSWAATVEEGGWIAHCGAGGSMFANGKPIPSDRTVFVPALTVLEIRPAPNGCYSYLAVGGGWDVPLVLGSRSTCLAAHFGGLEGRALQKGDLLQNIDKAAYPDFGSGMPLFIESRESLWISPWFLQLPRPAANILRVVPGPEWSHWTTKQQEQFFEMPFQVSGRRDRMGVRLQPSLPEKFKLLKSVSMHSTAVAQGAIQVPPDGWPIVLLADAQTTGGYPRIGQLAVVDIPAMAQLPAGKEVHFQQITLEEAKQLFSGQERKMHLLQYALSTEIRGNHHGINSRKGIKV